MSENNISELIKYLNLVKKHLDLNKLLKNNPIKKIVFRRIN